MSAPVDCDFVSVVSTVERCERMKQNVHVYATSPGCF